MNDAERLAKARETMIERHLKKRGIRDERVLEAMRRTQRERFVPLDLREAAYSDEALRIDCGQTISQPYIVAQMTEALELTGAEKVLEIGAGSGYQAAILSQLAKAVVSIERHPALYLRAQALLAELGYDNVTVVLGDGEKGWPAGAPYDRILLTAATGECPPALWEQLAEGGLLVGPFGPANSQTVQAIRKHAGAQEVADLGACRFVPLLPGIAAGEQTE
jgi:protein-L-isoaspartate(D-aspartate) O-methyltransferase